MKAKSQKKVSKKIKNLNSEIKRPIADIIKKSESFLNSTNDIDRGEEIHEQMISALLEFDRVLIRYKKIEEENHSIYNSQSSQIARQS